MIGNFNLNVEQVFTYLYSAVIIVLFRKHCFKTRRETWFTIKVKDDVGLVLGMGAS